MSSHSLKKPQYKQPNYHNIEFILLFQIFQEPQADPALKSFSTVSCIEVGEQLRSCPPNVQTDRTLIHFLNLNPFYYTCLTFLFSPFM